MRGEGRCIWGQAECLKGEHMKQYAVAHRSVERGSGPRKRLDQYYSVEIPVDALGVVYQFKICAIDSPCIFIVVTENSGILPWLKVGERLNMKYYSTDVLSPVDYLDTQIRTITKQDQARFKAHYLVGFEILARQDHDTIHWLFRPHKSQALPFTTSLSTIDKAMSDEI
jgi:hypothetical protein